MPETSSSLNGLFTLTSLVSLQGAAAASLIVPNVLTYLIGASFKPYEKWVAFAIAMLLSLLTALLAPSPDFTKWIVAVFNGFLIFASAIGINEAAARTGGEQLGTLSRGAKPRFFHSWF